jgi:hypothetical protein
MSMTEGSALDTESTPQKKVRYSLYGVRPKQSLDDINKEIEEETEGMRRHAYFWHRQTRQFRAFFAALFEEMPEGTMYLKLAEPLNDYATLSYGNKDQRQEIIGERGITGDRAPLELQPSTEELGPAVVCVDHYSVLCEVRFDITENLRDIFLKILSAFEDTLQWEDLSHLRQQYVTLHFCNTPPAIDENETAATIA